MELFKFGYNIQISEELLFVELSVGDGRYARQANVTRTPPTPAAWSRYHAAKAGYQAMEAYEGTSFGGPDYGPSVDVPEDNVNIEYLETHDEWMDRCRALARDTPDTPRPKHP